MSMFLRYNTLIIQMDWTATVSSFDNDNSAEPVGSKDTVVASVSMCRVSSFCQLCSYSWYPILAVNLLH